MNKKHYFRLGVVQYLDEFIESAEKITSDSKFIKLREVYGLAVGIEQSKVIELPSTLEFVIQNNLTLIPDYDEIKEDGKMKVKAFIINWDNVKGELICHLQKPLTTIEIKEGKGKKDEAINVIKVDLIILLLEKSLDIINKFFPLDEYGLPTDNFIKNILNIILGGELDLVLTPRLHNTIDFNSLLLKRENLYLRQKLIQNGIDINKEMLVDEFSYEQAAFVDILNKNPKYLVILEPNVKVREIKNQATTIVDEISIIDKEMYPEVSEYTGKLKDHYKSAELYVDLRFNQKMSVAQIANELFIKFGEDFKKEDINIRKEIRTMAKRSGFIDIHEEITKKNSEVNYWKYN